MERQELRDFWIKTDPAILCEMADGNVGILIIGPSNAAVASGDWRFGFQVCGEDEIRWRLSEHLERRGRSLIEVAPLVTNGQSGDGA